jgi:putative intracellular protease/amidase
LCRRHIRQCGCSDDTESRISPRGSSAGSIAVIFHRTKPCTKLLGAQQNSIGQNEQSADLATRRRPNANIGWKVSQPKDIDPKISVIARHVAFFIYPYFNLIDLSGPIEAFTLATDMAPGSYRLTVMSLEGGEIESSSHVKVMSQVAVPKGIDTFVIVGDAGMSERKISTETIDFIRAAAIGARRTASVCMGAFLLAASGLLDGRRVTTHWRFAAKLQAMYPNVRVDGDRIFINERGVWTSAGMTAGICPLSIWPKSLT